MLKKNWAALDFSNHETSVFREVGTGTGFWDTSGVNIRLYADTDTDKKRHSHNRQVTFRRLDLLGVVNALATAMYVA